MRKLLCRNSFHQARGNPEHAECRLALFAFEAVERRAVMANFAGGEITSNAGALLLGRVAGARGR